MNIKKFSVALGSLGFAIAALLVFFYYQGEKYQILRAVYLPTTNQAILREPGKLFYSNQKAMADRETFDLLQLAQIKSSELSEPNVMLAVIPNFTVKEVVGRQDFGFIMVTKCQTNGVSLTIFRGTKRFLQFNNADAQTELRILERKK
jgi:hypothetical protein